MWISRGSGLARIGAVFAACSAVLVIAACGSQSKRVSTAAATATKAQRAATTVSHPAPASRPASSTTTSTTAAGAGATTSPGTTTGATAKAPPGKSGPKHQARPVATAKPEGTTSTAQATTTSSVVPPTLTTIAAITPGPAYTGPSPEHCLQVAKLTDVRAGAESGVYIGNLFGTSPDDTTALVFVAGPYGSDDQAAQYAKSLQGVELATAGGQWVVSAALTSNLQIQVNAVATCMTPVG